MGTTTAALGDGPVVIYTSTQKQVEVPLSALSFAGNTIQIDPAYSAYSSILQPWLSYLVSTGRLRPGTAPPAVAAMIVSAADAGAAGNNIRIVTSIPDPSVPTTFDVTVTETETYTGLTAENLAAVLGTSAAAGSQPGLVRVVAGTFTMPGALAATKLGTGGGVVGDATKKATLPVTGAGGAAFTLEAKKVGEDGNLSEVTITPAADNSSFTLAVSWSKKVAGLKAADVATLDTALAPLAYEISVAKPASGFAQPLPGTVTLSGGVEPGTASQSVVASS